MFWVVLKGIWMNWFPRFKGFIHKSDFDVDDRRKPPGTSK